MNPEPPNTVATLRVAIVRSCKNGPLICAAREGLKGAAGQILRLEEVLELKRRRMLASRMQGHWMRPVPMPGAFEANCSALSAGCA
jgi:hypothetical protein